MEKEKGIKLRYGYGAYYRPFMFIETKGRQSKEEFIKSFIYAFTEQEWFQKNMNAGEVVYFLNKLSLEDCLYKNLIDNVYWLKEIQNDAEEIDKIEEWENIVTPNFEHYSDRESLSLFKEKKLTPYLENNEDFKNWFKNKLERENENLFIALFKKEEYRKFKNDKIKRDIDYKKTQIQHNNDYTKSLKKEIKELEKELGL